MALESLERGLESPRRSLIHGTRRRVPLWAGRAIRSRRPFSARKNCARNGGVEEEKEEISLPRRESEEEGRGWKKEENACAEAKWEAQRGAGSGSRAPHCFNLSTVAFCHREGYRTPRWTRGSTRARPKPCVSQPNRFESRRFRWKKRNWIRIVLIIAVRGESLRETVLWY